MANTLITPTQVLREALRILHNETVFVRKCNKEYSKEFAVSGAKIGSVVNVRMPNRYYVTRGTALQAQDTVENTVPVALTTNYQIGLNFTQQDLTLSLDDFSGRIIKPALNAMASAIDYDGLGRFIDIYNVVGTPTYSPGRAGGTAGSMTDSSSPQIFLNAGAMLNLMAAPADNNRTICYGPIAEATSVAGLSGLLNDQTSIGSQYKEGKIRHALGFDFMMDQNINSLTVGTHTATNAKVYGSSQVGSSIITNGWAAADFLNIGEVVTFAGVYSVNPENQKSTGLLANWVVTALSTADASGNMTISIAPSLKVIGSQIADGNCTASPANGAAVSVLTGASAVVSPQHMAFHSDAFTFATADLEMPKGVDMVARESFDGISMLLVRQYDINSQNFPCRLDVLGGWKTLRPELAVRVLG